MSRSTFKPQKPGDNTRDARDDARIIELLQSIDQNLLEALKAGPPPSRARPRASSAGPEPARPRSVQDYWQAVAAQLRNSVLAAAPAVARPFVRPLLAEGTDKAAAAGQAPAPDRRPSAAVPLERAGGQLAADVRAIHRLLADRLNGRAPAPGARPGTGAGGRPSSGGAGAAQTAGAPAATGAGARPSPGGPSATQTAAAPSAAPPPGGGRSRTTPRAAAPISRPAPAALPAGRGGGPGPTGPIPEAVARQFDAHPVGGLRQLRELLTKGIDPRRPFFTEALSPDRKQGPFVALGHPGQTLRQGGVASVLVDRPHARHIPALQQAYPHVRFVPAPQASQTLARVAAVPAVATPTLKPPAGPGAGPAAAALGRPSPAASGPAPAAKAEAPPGAASRPAASGAATPAGSALSRVASQLGAGGGMTAGPTVSARDLLAGFERVIAALEALKRPGRAAAPAAGPPAAAPAPGGAAGGSLVQAGLASLSPAGPPSAETDWGRTIALTLLRFAAAAG